jgi:hypothetical protein
MTRLPTEAEAFFEIQHEGFYIEALRLVKEEFPPKDEEAFIQALLSFYDSLYLDVSPQTSGLLSALGEKHSRIEMLLMALGWYLADLAKAEFWLEDFIKAWQECIGLCKEPTPIKKSINTISFGESAGFFVHNHIVSLFSKIQEENEKIHFLNLYLGVPIRFEASIVRIEDDEVTFRTSPLQEMAMKNDNQAYIMQNSILNKPVKAEVVYCNISQNEVTLRNFVYMFNMPAAMRDSARVHPRTATPVVLVDLEKRVGVEGIMFDISTGGLGVLGKSNDGLIPGSHVRVFFDLKDDENVSVETEAEVLDVIEYEDAYRFCMRFLPKEASMHEAIIKYVREREAEAIEKLKK